MLSYQFACATDAGRVRPNNEDAVRVDPVLGLAVLADGMGGYNAGEVASHLCCDTIVAALHAMPPDGDAGERLRRAVEAANRCIHDDAQRHPAHRGMATTVVAVLVHGARLTVAHVGDSRLYRLRQGRLAALTRDHTLVQEHIDAGWVAPEDGRHVGYRNLVTRAVGVSPWVAVELGEHAIEPGDTFLLCSDGLTDMLSDAEIAAILCRVAPGATAATALIAAANAAGGTDNIAVALIHCTHASESAPCPR